MLKYDVFKDGKQIKEDATFHELLNFFELKSSSFYTYVKNRVDDRIVVKGYTVIVKEKMNRQSDITNDLLNDWDEMTVAAELIRTGQGKIVRKLIDGRYRKVTVPR